MLFTRFPPLPDLRHNTSDKRDQYLLVLQISNISHGASDSQCRLYWTFQHRIKMHETQENVNNYKKCRKQVYDDLLEQNSYLPV